MEARAARFALEDAFVERVNWIAVAAQLADEALPFADLKMRIYRITSKLKPQVLPRIS